MTLLHLPGISLQDLSAASSLQARQDRKYIVDNDLLAQLVQALAGEVAVLEVDGVRSSRYATRYYDTPHLLTARHHAQGVRRRFKARTRTYIDSGLVRLELKGKGRGGQTVKYALDGAAPGLDARGRTFLRQSLDDCYGAGYLPAVVDGLAPTLDMTCRRTTLVGMAEQVRVTADRDLQFGQLALRPDLVVLEVKSAGPRTRVDRLLLGLGARPTSFSKYVAAVELTCPGAVLRAHPTRLLERCFTRDDVDLQKAV